MPRSRVAYGLLVAAFAIERLVELVVSRRHRRALLARGAEEHGAGHYPAMVAIHAGLLVGCALEPVLARRRFVPALGIPMLGVALAAQALRWWAVRSLGVHWCTRVVVLAGAPRIVAGPYRWCAHPNYVAVVAEGIALPLVHSAWITSLAFTSLDAAVLRLRIRAEDEALRAMRSP